MNTWIVGVNTENLAIGLFGLYINQGLQYGEIRDPFVFSIVLGHLS
ncbi:hypothetical protein [Leptothoe kymatousa]|uniref:Uncharacterized protein n=1 Tax=Leptothoe kymatousa TAU-MAC 1615 TaxID=2364775 RepID=A0ABS5Y676_9CYAN|nr:hypothetical protein [Leptothoe kymatousa]MBT9313328.1 hypothetical protein [Leptothoe kymatousa TAU-MAC 1615]